MNTANLNIKESEVSKKVIDVRELARTTEAEVLLHAYLIAEMEYRLQEFHGTLCVYNDSLRDRLADKLNDQVDIIFDYEKLDQFIEDQLREVH